MYYFHLLDFKMSALLPMSLLFMCNYFVIIDIIDQLSFYSKDN